MTTTLAWLVWMGAFIVIGVALHRYWVGIAKPRLEKADRAAEHEDAIPGIAWMLTHGLILMVSGLTELCLLAILVNSI